VKFLNPFSTAVTISTTCFNNEKLYFTYAFSCDSEYSAIATQSISRLEWRHCVFVFVFAVRREDDFGQTFKRNRETRMSCGGEDWRLLGCYAVWLL
jgi:hypothetical protein